MRRPIRPEPTRLGERAGGPFVFTRRVRVAYIGAKFGSATITS